MPLDQLEKGVNIKGLVLPETPKEKSFDIFEEITAYDLQMLKASFKNQVDAGKVDSFSATGSALKIFDPEMVFSEFDAVTLSKAITPTIDNQIRDGLWFDVGMNLMHLKQMGINYLSEVYNTEDVAKGLKGMLGIQSQLTWVFAKSLMAAKVLGVFDQTPLTNPDELEKILLVKAQDSRRQEDLEGFFSRSAAARTVFPNAGVSVAGIEWKLVKSKLDEFRERDWLIKPQTAQNFSNYISDIAIVSAGKVSVTDRGIELTRRSKEFQPPTTSNLPQRRRF